MSALRIKNTSESDPRSYEVTNKAQKKFSNGKCSCKYLDVLSTDRESAYLARCILGDLNMITWAKPALYLFSVVNCFRQDVLFHNVELHLV